MGQELVRHMLAHGHDVRVFNRTPERAEEVVRGGATPTSSPQDAVADADALVTILFGPQAIQELVLGGDLRPPAGTVWIDVTTIGPRDADEFAAWSAARGIRYVHSPVLGSLGPAREGRLGVLLGGEADAVEAASAITNMWADPTRVRIFDTAARAAAAKLVVNLGLAVATQGLAEALLLGRSAGLEADAVLDVLAGTPLGGVVAAKGRTLLDRSFSDAQFTVDALAKDARLAISASAVPLPALEVAAAALLRCQEAGRGGEDFSVMASAG